MASPELQTIVQMIRQQAQARQGQPSIEEMRAGIEAMAAMFPVPPDVQREPVVANGVPAEWLVAPGAAADRAILYLHGGGYVVGSITSHRDLAARISRAAGTRVMIIDYRLAPEHPFPAAVDDALVAYRWLIAQQLDPRQLVIAGDSAGGGLTIATLVALRDAGDPLPAAAVTLSPWVDLEAIGESMTTRADLDPMLQRDGLLGMATAYLGGADPRTALAAPLYADLTGLPPLLIQVGTAEMLHSDATRLAERAQAAGVDVTLDVWDDMFHVWQMYAAMLPEGQQAIERIGQFVQSALGARV